MAMKLWGCGADKATVRGGAYATALDLLRKLEGSGEFAESVHLREALRLVVNAERISRGESPYVLPARHPRIGA